MTFSDVFWVNNTVHKVLPTAITCSSKAGVDADFKLVKVDVPWRQTDGKNRVGEGDWAGQLQQRNVTNEPGTVPVRVKKHVGHPNIHNVWVRIRRENSSESYF